jgi:hypothetical protein
MTQTVDYQGCQPFGDKLSDQPSEIAVFFFAEGIVLLATFSQTEKNMAK